MNKLAPQAVPAKLTESKRTNLARELFTSNFWMSGLAMLKYIPRSFRVKQVDGMAFFTDAKHESHRSTTCALTVDQVATAKNSREESWQLQKWE